MPDAANDSRGRTERLSTAPGANDVRGTALDLDALVSAGYARFELLGELGRGGMGVVHRAFDPAIQREIALKVLLSRDPSPEALARFVREARITGQLEHAGIPPVYELGLTSEGFPYFAMKLVRGQSLRALLDALREPRGRGRRSAAAFPLARRLEVLCKVAETLAYAHSRGVIHRDLKPDNVMVGEFGEVQLMDWGLARLTDDTAPERGESRRVQCPSVSGSQLTQEGAVAGTPAYMAPEQAQGDVHALDERTDVFALGALLYELLTLSPPYRGGTALEIVVLASDGAWEPIERRLAATGWPLGRPPRELVAIAEHALAPDRDARYPSVPALLADLRAFGSYTPVSVHRDPPWSRVIKRVQRHPRAAVVAVSVVVLGLGFAMARRQVEAARLRSEMLDLVAQQKTSEAERIGQLATSQLSEESRLALDDFQRQWNASKARGEPDRHFAALDPQRIDAYLLAYDGLLAVYRARGSRPSAILYFQRGLLRQVRGDLAGALEDYGQALDIDPRHGATRYNRALARTESGDFAGAVGDLDQLLEIELRNAAALNARGAARRALGDITGAIADYNRCLEIDPRHLKAIVNRGFAHEARGDIAAALADYDLALGVDPACVSAWLRRGAVRSSQGDRPGAIRDYDAALAIDPRNAVALCNRGVAREASGDLDGALADLEAALAIDPRHLDALNARGTVRQARGELAEAIADYETALSIDPRYAKALGNRGSARAARGDVQGAIADYDRALAIDPRQVKIISNRATARYSTGDVKGALADLDLAVSTSPREAWLFAKRGAMRQEQGDDAGAIADCEAALAVDPRCANALSIRGDIRRAQGSFELAIADYDRALAIEPSRPDVLNNRGRAWALMGNMAEALADFERALAVDSTFWMAAFNRGIALAASQRSDEALRAMQNALLYCGDPAMRSRIEAKILELGGRPER